MTMNNKQTDDAKQSLIYETLAAGLVNSLGSPEEVIKLVNKVSNKVKKSERDMTREELQQHFREKYGRDMRWGDMYDSDEDEAKDTDINPEQSIQQLKVMRNKIDALISQKEDDVQEQITRATDSGEYFNKDAFYKLMTYGHYGWKIVGIEWNVDNEPWSYNLKKDDITITVYPEYPNPYDEDGDLLDDVDAKKAYEWSVYVYKNDKTVCITSSENHVLLGSLVHYAMNCINEDDE